MYSKMTGKKDSRLSSAHIGSSHIELREVRSLIDVRVSSIEDELATVGLSDLIAQLSPSACLVSRHWQISETCEM